MKKMCSQLRSRSLMQASYLWRMEDVMFSKTPGGCRTSPAAATICATSPSALLMFRTLLSWRTPRWSSQGKWCLAIESANMTDLSDRFKISHIQCIQVETHASTVMGVGLIMLKPYGRTHRSGYCRPTGAAILAKRRSVSLYLSDVGKTSTPQWGVPYDAGAYIYWILLLGCTGSSCMWVLLRPHIGEMCVVHFFPREGRIIGNRNCD